MIIMLAGLQNVPTELYDAAKVDGANAFWRFFKISIPMISPVIFYNLVLATIAAFQYFLTAFVIYQNTAGPNNAALFYMMNLYKEAFVYYNMGYASALAWGLFLVGLAVTIGLFASAKRWVYYAGGETNLATLTTGVASNQRGGALASMSVLSKQLRGLVLVGTVSLFAIMLVGLYLMPLGYAASLSLRGASVEADQPLWPSAREVRV